MLFYFFLFYRKQLYPNGLVVTDPMHRHYRAKIKRSSYRYPDLIQLIYDDVLQILSNAGKMQKAFK